MERPGTGWKTRAETTTEIWTERDGSGQYVFRYVATVQTFIGTGQGDDQLFEQKAVEGLIPRLWV